MEIRYNNEVKRRKETEEALAREKEELEQVKLQLVTLKIKHEDMCIKAEEFEGKSKSELILTIANLKQQLALEKLRKDAMRKEMDNALKLVNENTSKHQNMCIKAEELESKYKKELILRKAYNIDADAMREERDNAIKLVHEITTTKQEVMKDPQLTSDGYTYEAEAIKRWINKGHDTSPMTNLKLSHTNLVPNRALRSAIQELV
ncbi:unnamed protein product [Arabis nemorensis]|uniref:U-box domain-containing protein n=1 Tax=Arabis nemorensis TaxID=586526 RepID=A0A565AWT3_9BRAS|nr:unnamed protein product [Arabis nemorensis]